MASIIKRCGCGGDDWDGCPHPWAVRYRTDGGRSSRQREKSFGDDRREAVNFLLKVEHDKKAHVFIDPEAGKATFRAEAALWLAQRIGADSSDAAYRSVLRTHVYPVIGDRQIRTVRREEIKEIIATMSRKGLSPSRIAAAHLVINAVFNEAVRNKKLPASPCTDIPLPGVVHAADFVFPEDGQLDALAAGLPADWAATVWLMYGCGLRIGEALAVRNNCRINRGTTLRAREQVNLVAELKPLKFRAAGQFRDIPLPLYVSEAIDKHIADHGTTADGYLFQGRRHKHVTRRTYNQDFGRRREGRAAAGVHPAHPATLLRLHVPGPRHPDHRGLPLARPQEHRGHPPDLRPPRARLLGPRPRRPGRRPPRRTAAAAAPGNPELNESLPDASPDRHPPAACHVGVARLTRLP
jgi:integrase